MATVDEIEVAARADPALATLPPRIGNFTRPARRSSQGWMFSRSASRLGWVGFQPSASRV